MKALRKKAEYLLFKGAMAVIPRLSRPAVLRLGRIGAWAGWLFSPSLRKVARANLDLVYGEAMEEARKKRIIRRSFRTFSQAMLDSLWFSRDSESRIRRWVRFDPSLEKFFREGAMVCITGHFGNWEALGLITALHGQPLVSVYKPLKNPAVDREFRALRTHTGQDIVETGGAFRKLLRKLKEGRKIGLVMDQNTKADQGGEFFPFLGMPALVTTAPASLAIMTGAPVYTGFCRPHPDGSYEAFSTTGLIDTKPYREMGDTGPHALTARLVEVFEQAIRAEPENWLWMYKRWKYLPPEGDPARFPFYAKKMG